MQVDKSLVLRRFKQLSLDLKAKGFPETAPWWVQQVERWYLSGKRQAVYRVGRRGGKSSTLSRLAVCEALYGGHSIPPGDVGVVAIISTRKEEAVERLRTIKAILDAIGIKYRERDLTLELRGRPIIFRVYVATIAGVSGFTGIFILCDEVAKWKDLDTGLNPAGEVIASVRPTLLTQPGGRIVLSSSPMGVHDAHFAAYEEGEADLQTIGYAPSWIANPSVTEADTHALEPDEARWQREYKAIPQEDSDSSLLSASHLKRAERTQFAIDRVRYKYLAAIDPATRGNAWTLVVTTQDENQIRQVVLAKQWIGSRAKPLSPLAVFQEIKLLLAPYGLEAVWSDQYAGDALREIARVAGVYVMIEPWTQALKADAYEYLRELVLAARFEMIADPVLRSDLLGIKLRIGRSGISYDLDSDGTRHSDYAPAVAMAIWKSRARGIPVAPQLTVQEEHDAWKNKWLMEREKDRIKSEKSNVVTPVTHRKRLRGIPVGRM